MKEFSLIFRRPISSSQLSDHEKRSLMEQWDNWIHEIKAEGKYIPGGRLENKGKVLNQSGLITDGPFIEIKELLLGFIIVAVDDEDEAITLAHGCPILGLGGNVEIREIFRGDCDAELFLSHDI